MLGQASELGHHCSVEVKGGALRDAKQLEVGGNVDYRVAEVSRRTLLGVGVALPCKQPTANCIE